MRISEGIGRHMLGAHAKDPLSGVNYPPPVRLKIIAHEMIKIVGKSESCMVSRRTPIRTARGPSPTLRSGGARFSAIFSSCRARNCRKNSHSARPQTQKPCYIYGWLFTYIQLMSGGVADTRARPLARTRIHSQQSVVQSAVLVLVLVLVLVRLVFEAEVVFVMRA